MHVCLQLANSVYSSCSVFLLFWVIFGLIKLISFQYAFFPFCKSLFLLLINVWQQYFFFRGYQAKRTWKCDCGWFGCWNNSTRKRWDHYISFELPASLHISLSSLPFRFGQVCSQVWCRPYMAMYFGFFELWMFPWLLCKVLRKYIFPFTLHSK